MKKKTTIWGEVKLYRNNKISLIRKINALENEVEVLQDTIKDELYKIFMDKLNEPYETKRLKEENKRLRKKNKFLLSELKPHE